MPRKPASTSGTPLADIVARLLEVFTQALDARREDRAEVARIQAERDQIAADLRESQSDDEQVTGIADQLEDLVNRALAAKPPTDENVAVVTGGGTPLDPVEQAARENAANADNKSAEEDGESEE